MFQTISDVKNIKMLMQMFSEMNDIQTKRAKMLRKGYTQINIYKSWFNKTKLNINYADMDTQHLSYNVNDAYCI